MGVRRTGDWDKARAKLTTGMGPRLATIRNALFLVREIQRGIRSQAPGGQAFVGLLRGTVNKDGEDMVNIGAVMEYGATIKHPNGATIIIPARPFLNPVMEEYREQILQNYREAIRSAL